MSSSREKARSKILVVDDEPDLRTLYELALLREGYLVDAAGSLAEARTQVEHSGYAVVITDMRLPDGLGLELLHELQARRRTERCIVMTAYGSAENAVEALKAGAFDYLTKPVDLKQFRAVVASAIHEDDPLGGEAGGAATTCAARADAPMVADPAAPSPTEASSSAGQEALARLVGNSEALCSVKRRIAKVARSMAPVLVRGESGTGKELVAHAIHACSHRANGPFVAVNCGAIPENLLEAEFFGARKGSYTGATQDREGYFHAARGGTLFLDEIGDLPLAMQSKLLRAIQERRVRPLGATQEDEVDVRFVSATHKDLAGDVHAGRFRQDLYYRLNVIDIVVPPLRERRQDLAVLCDALLSRIARESGLPKPVMSASAMALLMKHPLQGNVRELENLLHRALALSDGGELNFDDLGPAPPMAVTGTPDPAPHEAVANLASGPMDLQAWLDDQERALLIRTLNDTGFNRTAAAARLGLNLRQIRYRMSRLGITGPSRENESETNGFA